MNDIVVEIKLHEVIEVKKARIDLINSLMGEGKWDGNGGKLRDFVIHERWIEEEDAEAVYNLLRDSMLVDISNECCLYLEMVQGEYFKFNKEKNVEYETLLLMCKLANYLNKVYPQILIRRYANERLFDKLSVVDRLAGILYIKMGEYAEPSDAEVIVSREYSEEELQEVHDKLVDRVYCDFKLRQIFDKKIGHVVYVEYMK